MPSSSPDLFIGLDSSTSATKALIWDHQGNLAAEGRGSYPLSMPRPGWHEQPAEAWWAAAVQALRTALGQIDLARLGAVCITHQRETFVPVDERGRPLHPALVWMDERARGLLPEIERQYGREHFHRVTGKPLSSNLSVGKILWLRLHSPAVFEQTHKFLDVQGFLVHCLTGHFRTGIGSADPTGLFDMARGGWAEDLLAQLGVRLEQLPETFPQGTVLGQVSPQAAESSGLPVGLPVVAGIGDGQAAGLGVDITRPDEAFLNLGTAVVSGGYTEQFITDRAFRTTYGPIPGTYFIETVLPGGTYTINWFLSEFGDPAAAAMGEAGAMQVLDAAAATIPPGALGLLLLPYWNGVMSPYWDAAATGAVLGWRGIHQRPHLYRAILEGIAFEQRLHTSGVEAILGLPVARYVAVGGGARNPLWCQIIADITGKEVACASTPEATALGAGILAAAGVGAFPDVRRAAAAMASQRPLTFTPDPARQSLYDRLFTEVYQHLYPLLAPYLRRLTEITEQLEAPSRPG